MASPPAPKRPTTGGGGFFDLFRLRRRQYSEDGSSRRGRRYWDRGEDYSVGKDSSTHSALFDLELSTRGVPVGALGDDRSGHGGLSRAAGELHAKLQRIAYLARPVAGFEVDLLHQVQVGREVCARADGQVDLMALARRLHALGYACSLQCNDPAAAGDPAAPGTSSSGGGGGGAVDGTCLEKLRHRFIVCTGRRDGSAAHYCIVDPQFRDQFRIGQPTEGYEAMLGVVPAEFVGSPLRLQALADLLCTEIVEVYRGQGLPLPPWRKSAAMLSRWFDVSGQGAAAAVAPPPPPPVPPPVQPPAALAAVAGPAVAAPGGVAVQLDRGRSGGWSELATIQETPSPHHGVASTLAGSGSDLFPGGASAGGTSPASSAGDAGRQRGSAKMVSLLARGLSGLGLKGASARVGRDGPARAPSGTKQGAQR